VELAGLGVVVTGGISGLGLAAADELERAGSNVVAIDRRTPESPGTRLTLRADISDADAVQEAIAKAKQHLGSIHVAVNCAGTGISGLSVGEHATLTASGFRRVLEINTVGTFNVCQAAAEQMLLNEPNEDGERGVLINVASTAALEGQIGTTAYAASKAAIIGMMLPLARELAPFGIRVVTVSPGIFETDMFRAASPDMQDWLRESTPFPSRAGKPPEFASLVRQIVENPMLNGEVIRLDGMLRLGSGQREWFHPRAVRQA
jgi:3-hydroxyacyl-CoA dehydrogenase / 3-hydroxy-2-methylbutyryl-CoA dehydrogenase